MILAAQIMILVGFIGLLIGFAIASFALRKNNMEWTKNGCDVAFRGILIMIAATAVFIFVNLTK